jgi:hypothetical protein
MLRTISCIELRISSCIPIYLIKHTVYFFKDLNRLFEYVIGFYNVLVCQFLSVSQQDIDIIIYSVSQINSRFHFGYVIVNPQSFSPLITASEFISR